MSIAAPQHVVNPFRPLEKLDVGGVDQNEHVARLLEKGVRIGATSRWVMCHRLNKPGPKRTITPGWCQVGELGFTEPPTTTQLVERASWFGNLCPCGTPGHLQEAFIANGIVMKVSVLMVAIPDQLGTPQMLTVERTEAGICRIKERYAHPGQLWQLDSRVVAAIPG